MSHTTTFARRLSPYVLLAGVLILFFWPVWLLGASFPVGGGDLWGQLLPVWTYVGHVLRQGRLALWSTQIMAGDPIAAEPQYGLLNPLNWWLFVAGAFTSGALPRDLVLARGVLPLYIAGAGLYTYLRRSPMWRVGRAAALFGSIAYMLSDPFITHLGHPQMNDGMAWLPWALLSVDLTIEERRFRPQTAAVLALVALSGHYQTILFTATAAMLYAIWRLLGQRPRTWGRHAGRLGLAAVCAAALAAPPLLASLERYPFTERSILQIEAWTGYAWQPQMALDLLAPGLHGRGVADFWAPWARVEGGYVGAIALFLAGLGFLYGLRRGRTWIVVVIGALGTLFALGFNGPLYPLLTHIDLIARMNKPARAIFLLAFAIAVLAAAGVEALRRRPAAGTSPVTKSSGLQATPRERSPATTTGADSPIHRAPHTSPAAPSPGGTLPVALILWSFLLVGGAVLVYTRLPQWLEQVPAGRRGNAVESLIVAGAGALAVLLLAWLATTRSRLAVTALLLLLVGELVITGTWVELEPAGASAPSPVIAYLRGDPNWYRVDVDASARGLLSPSVLVNEGFDVPQGSGNPMELFSYTQFYWAIPTKGSPAYQLLGAKYIVVPKDALPGGQGIWPVFTDAPTVDVHLNTNALPRVWLVYDTVPIDTIEAANAIVFDRAFEPARVATVEDGPDLNGQGTGSLEVAAYGGNRVDVVVRTSEQALLVLSDFDYPGWIAAVDDGPVPLYRTDGIFRGVVVPSGEHRVTMRYRPVPFRLGLGLAAMALLVMAAAALRASPLSPKRKRDRE